MSKGSSVTARLTKDEVKAAGCEGKEAFTKYNTAIKVCRKQGRQSTERFHVYRCQICQSFHIGTSAVRRRPAIAVATEAEWEEMDFIERNNKL